MQMITKHAFHQGVSRNACLQIKIICTSIQHLEYQPASMESQGDAYCLVTAAFIAVISDIVSRVCLNGRVSAS